MPKTRNPTPAWLKPSGASVLDSPVTKALRTIASLIGSAMPARSKSQQRYMAIVEHNAGAVRGPVPQMTHRQLHDFAATPTKGLPVHVKTAGHPHQNLGKYLHPKKAR